MSAPQSGTSMAGHWKSIVTASAGLRLAWALCLVACLVGTSAAQSQKFYDIDLHAPNLAEALNGLSEQTGAPIVFSYDLVRGRSAPAITGRYTLLAALHALLQDSGLAGGLSDKGVLTVAAAAPNTQQGGETSLNNDSTQNNTNRHRATGAAGIAAFFAAIAAPFAAHADDAAEDGSQLAAVVITAQKREERLQDVPIAVTAVKASDLIDNNQVLLRDYFASVPGLSLSPNINGSQMLSIRGVTTGGFTTPTVGITVDDVPYGATAGRGDGNFVPDLDPGDLSRIEVLRGPQGTLYGANSMGGLVKYVTVDPAFDGLHGRVETGVSSVYKGAQPGLNLRASSNIPLADNFAIRASGFVRQDPGYIDNPVLGLHGVNKDDAFGGRLAALWRPSSDFSLKLSALYQRTENEGISEVNKLPGLGDLQQDYIAGLGGTDRTVEAYSAIARYKTDAIELVSLTGYNINEARAPRDYTPSLGSITQHGIPGSGFDGFGVKGTDLDTYINYRKVTQELRASSSLGQSFDWLLGGFYSHESDDNNQIITVTDPLTGQVYGQEYYEHYPDVYREYAGFADLTWHVTQRFDLQVGGRESQTRISEFTYATGPIVLVAFHQAPPIDQPEVVESGNAFTYLVTPQFKVSPDLNLYARAASGYRPGGPNPPLPGVASLQPDKTRDYELGLKGDFLEHVLSVDLSLYYIDWNNIQLTLNSPARVTYGFNGSRAKSEGAELALATVPVHGLSFTSWVAYDNAVLTENFPANSTAYGVSGNRLPNTPKYSANASLQQEFPLWGSITGCMAGAVSFVGDRTSVFTTNTVRQDMPSYTETDLRVSMKGNSWTANLYVNNVADIRGMLNGGIGYSQPNTFIYITPRTVGLSFSKSF